MIVRDNIYMRGQITVRTCTKETARDETRIMAYLVLQVVAVTKDATHCEDLGIDDLEEDEDKVSDGDM